jgi:hypothetical protein
MRKIVVIVIWVMIFFLGCRKEKPQIEIPKNMEITKLSDILRNPADYHNKKVLLQGFVVSVCESGCHIVYQEEKNTIEIYPKGFKFSRMKKGTPIKVYAEVTAGKERAIISVLKLEVVR